MTLPHVTEFKTKDGRVSGRIGPNYLSPLETAMALFRAYFRKADLPIALSVSKAESSLSPDAEGDLLRMDAEWGPSCGLMQIRSRKDELGTGKARDAKKLHEVNFNLRQARIIFENHSWKPWGAYTNGAYKEHMPMARRVCDYLGVWR
jgi:hypothetical protein